MTFSGHSFYAGPNHMRATVMSKHVALTETTTFVADMVERLYVN
jgi:hypothetical protein